MCYYYGHLLSLGVSELKWCKYSAVSHSNCMLQYEELEKLMMMREKVEWQIMEDGKSCNSVKLCNVEIMEYGDVAEALYDQGMTVPAPAPPHMLISNVFIAWIRHLI